ncbi:MAG: hypothetical protein FWC60_12015 [Firmicutes bacterium]|nr:hypothetical protein [Bacillota bacterium]
MAKKTVKAEKAGKKDAQRESIAKELRGLIPQLDSEGLAFLVEQARVHLYNMQVEELNKAAVAADAAASRSASLAGKAAPGRGTSKAAAENFRIDGSESGSSFYIHYRNNEVMFSRDEMTRLVKIANGEGTDLEIRERLYNWFDRERTDVFAVVPIKDKFDDRLKTLVAMLKKTFKLRK